MDKPLTLPRGVAPRGARLGGRTPQETIQMIGKSRAVVPQNIDIDLGVVDAFITNAGQNIGFRGKGELTNVGSRIASTTQGMDLGEGGEDLFGISEAEAMGYPQRTNKPKRKVRHTRPSQPPPTILGGMRL